MKANRFLVRSFEDETKIGELFLTEDGLQFEKLLPLSTQSIGIDGFYAGGSDAPDFIVTTGKVKIDGRVAPDWGAESIVGLQGRTYRLSELVRSQVLSLLFLRRLQVFDRAGLVISRWYVVPWREWVLPVDPLMPWGRDFCKFLQFRIGVKQSSRSRSASP